MSAESSRIASETVEAHIAAVQNAFNSAQTLYDIMEPMVHRLIDSFSVPERNIIRSCLDNVKKNATLHELLRKTNSLVKSTMTESQQGQVLGQFDHMTSIEDDIAFLVEYFKDVIASYGEEMEEIE